MPRSAARACSPMKSSWITCAAPGAESGAHTGAQAASRSRAGGSPTGRNGSPARRTARPADPGPATSTSWPARAQACAKGTIGPTWPAPAVVAKRIRTQVRRAGPRSHSAHVGDDVRMAYDEDLANLIRELIAGEPDVTEKRMFGG